MPITQIDAKPALVIIDLQKGLRASNIQLSPHSIQEVIERNVKAANSCRAKNIPVFLVRAVLDYRPPGRTSKPSNLRGTAIAPDFSDIIPELAGHDEDIIITKRNWGAFYGTDLDIQLRRRGITQVILTGIVTIGGVESTARDAYERGYNLVVLEDAVSDRSEETHRHSVEKIFERIGEVGSTEEFIEMVERRQ